MVPRPKCSQFIAPLPAHDERLKSELVADLDEHLLRGVPLDVCLAGFGRHWEPGQRHGKDAQLFDLSQPTHSIETFLSHDWGTSRWQKLLAMLVLFNSRAASLAAMSLCVLCMIPTMMAPSLAGWFIIPGYVVFVFFAPFLATGQSQALRIQAGLPGSALHFSA
eukprot:Skav202264  [mRNA]  locus=scaffold1417:427704:428195:+ [translate_table: standard]